VFDEDLCKIDVLVHGRGIVEQDGPQAALASRDLAFVDLSRPVRWVMSPIRLVAVVFPRVLLPLRRDEVARLTAVRIRGDASGSRHERAEPGIEKNLVEAWQRTLTPDRPPCSRSMRACQPTGRG
jgi:hypothetical protein